MTAMSYRSCISYVLCHKGDITGQNCSKHKCHFTKGFVVIVQLNMYIGSRDYIAVS